LGKKRKRRGGGKSKQKKRTIKSHNLYPLTLGGLASYGAHVQSMPEGKYGASLAFMLVQEVRASILKIVESVLSFRWDIVKYPGIERENGEIIARSNDVGSRHSFQKEMRNFREINGTSLLDVIAWSWLLYGEVFIERNIAPFAMITLDWLNPRGVTVQYDNQVTGYRYGWANEYISFKPEEIAYWHNRNSENDFIGLPIVSTILDQIDITRDVARYWSRYFINDARPGAAASPTGDQEFFEKDSEQLRQQFKSEHRGTQNAWRMAVFNRPMNIVTFDAPDLSKHVTLDQHISQKIYSMFGVDPAILGDTTASQYKDKREQFYRFTVIPLARNIEEFINLSLLPYYIAPGEFVRFEFDTSAFDAQPELDRQQAELINLQVSGGLMDLYTAAEQQGITPNPAQRGMYNIGGMLVPASEIRTLWEKQLPMPSDSFGLESFDLEAPNNSDDIGTDSAFGEQENTPFPFEIKHKGMSCSCSKHDEISQHDEDLMWDLEYDDQSYHDQIINELNTLRKFVAERKSGRKKNNRPFECHALPFWLSHKIQDEFNKGYSSVFSYEQLTNNPRVKSLESYKRFLRSNIRGLWSGELDRPQFESNMKRLIENEFRIAFEDGVKRGGASMSDLTDEQRAKIGELIAQEQSHVAQFADAIIERSRAEGGRLGQLQARADNWIVRFSQVEKYGYAVANWDKRLVWRRNPQADGCVDCLKLDGKVKFGRVFFEQDVIPQSSRLNCFLGCRCDLEETDMPISRGRLPRLIGPQ